MREWSLRRRREFAQGWRRIGAGPCRPRRHSLRSPVRTWRFRMRRSRNGWIRGLVLLSLAFSMHAVQAASCDEVRILVSGYYSNVHIYDACTGAFLRNLDEEGRIRGAQAVKLGPDGRLWVVSEDTS